MVKLLMRWKMRYVEKRKSRGWDYRRGKITFFTARRLIELFPTTLTPLPLSLSDWIATAEKVREGTPARRGWESVEEMTLHLNSRKLVGNFPEVLSNTVWSEINFMRWGGEWEHFPFPLPFKTQPVTEGREVTLDVTIIIYFLFNGISDFFNLSVWICLTENTNQQTHKEKKFLRN